MTNEAPMTNAQELANRDRKAPDDIACPGCGRLSQNEPIASSAARSLWQDVKPGSCPHTFVAFENDSSALNGEGGLPRHRDCLQGFPAAQAPGSVAVPVKMPGIVRVTPGSNVHPQRFP